MSRPRALTEIEALRLMQALSTFQQFDPKLQTRDGIVMAALAAVMGTLVERNIPQDFFGDIERFHTHFGQAQDDPPQILGADEMTFRTVAMEEELEEWKEAVKKGDLEAMFDALIDLTYFTLGTAYRMGLPFREGWRRVHEKNMLKQLAKSKGDSKRGYKLDIVKPEGWTPANLKDLLV